MHPSPPFRIRLPRVLKGSNHALPENKKSSTVSKNDVNMMDACAEKEKLIVEAYTPPDPGPYPQDQPKQNSVRFTPTQVSFFHCHPPPPPPFSFPSCMTIFDKERNKINELQDPKLYGFLKIIKERRFFHFYDKVSLSICSHISFGGTPLIF